MRLCDKRFIGLNIIILGGRTPYDNKAPLSCTSARNEIISLSLTIFIKQWIRRFKSPRPVSIWIYRSRKFECGSTFCCKWSRSRNCTFRTCSNIYFTRPLNRILKSQIVPFSGLALRYKEHICAVQPFRVRTGWRWVWESLRFIDTSNIERKVFLTKAVHWMVSVQLRFDIPLCMHRRSFLPSRLLLAYRSSYGMKST